MRLITGIGISLLLLSSLAACQGQNARDILGLDRRSPDEFRVVARPPLSTPKELTLRAPQKGQDSFNLPAPDIQARALMTEEKDLTEIQYDYTRKMGEAETAVGVVKTYNLGSEAEMALLDRAGVSSADPTIRDRLYDERQSREEKVEDQWLFPRKDDDSVIVDAEAERERLKANQDAGLPATEGETPVIEPKQRGVLEGLF